MRCASKSYNDFSNGKTAPRKFDQDANRNIYRDGGYLRDNDRYPRNPGQSRNSRTTEDAEYRYKDQGNSKVGNNRFRNRGYDGTPNKNRNRSHDDTSPKTDGNRSFDIRTRTDPRRNERYGSNSSNRDFKSDFKRDERNIRNDNDYRKSDDPRLRDYQNKENGSRSNVDRNKNFHKDANLKKPAKYISDSTRLKFDPQDKGDFTRFGILPFFQNRLNKILLPKDQLVADVPNVNIKPTPDQRKMLSILNSNHNLVLKGGPDSGKTLALLAYALNYSLSATPNYDLIDGKRGLNSIIIVPTQNLVRQCERYIYDLLNGIPQDCCPNKLIKDGDAYELTRSPLGVEFFYGGFLQSSYSTGKETKPHILITTIEGLEDLGFASNGNPDTKVKKLNTSITPEYFESVKFVGVDRFDLFLKSSTLNHTTLIVKSDGPKGRYTHKLESIIKSIQDISCESYSASLRNRLQVFETAYKHDKYYNRDETTRKHVNDVNHTELVMHARPEDSVPGNVISDLYKLLMKQKRKMLYKTIQYAFVGLADETYKRILELKQTLAIQQDGPHLGSTAAPSIRSDLDKQLVELYKELNQKNSPEDGAVKFAEKVVRFTNAQRALRDKERTIVTATSDLPVISRADNISAMLAVTGKAPDSSLAIISEYDTISKAPTTDELTFQHMDNHLSLSLNNYKNYEKAYIKAKILPRERVVYNMEKTVNATISLLRKKFNENIPVLIVLPDFVDLVLLVKALDKPEHCTYLDEKAITAQDHPSYIFANSSSLMDHNIDGISRMVVISLDALLPQFAFASKTKYLRQNQKPVNLQDITGLNDPFNDLSTFYLNKLKKSTTPEKTIIFVLDQYDERLKRQINELHEQDKRRFSQILMYNNLHNSINFEHAEDGNDRPVLNYGVDKKLKDILLSNARYPQQ